MTSKTNNYILEHYILEYIYREKYKDIRTQTYIFTVYNTT